MALVFSLKNIRDKKKEKKIVGKDFLLQESAQKEVEDSEKKGKIEMFPFRYVVIHK